MTVFDYSIFNAELAPFGVSAERGFLPIADPLQKLPSMYERWDELGRELPKLLTGYQVRRTVDAMPELDVAGLSNDAELNRAMMILSYLGHAYVWETMPYPQSFPRSLAVPWAAIAKRLGRPPVLSYASYALHNWKKLDPLGPVALGNIALLQNFLGGIDEEWFILIHVEIEAKAAGAVAAQWAAQSFVEKSDVVGVGNALSDMVETFTSINQTMDRMPERCDPYIYFNRVRPYIHGWKNNPALPAGMVYDGVVEFFGAPQFLRGETGSQSAIVPMLDAGLGIVHQDDPLRHHLREMEEYMPSNHRALIQESGRRPSIRRFVEANKAVEPKLKETFNELIGQIEKFRSTHLEYAATYIFKQVQKDAGNPAAVGTGGTPFMPYLKKHRDETGSQRIT